MIKKWIRKVCLDDMEKWQNEMIGYRDAIIKSNAERMESNAALMLELSRNREENSRIFGATEINETRDIAIYH